ncbi:MAG: xanthine dehydrogenase family protein molybdopterin-binding subunit [Lachnospiraceae bacterium]|jgi:CO/xanthine dehydrogenase Mo-binding subunit|nr:xanthine dehydrogenase family protein molybdopterin-binding subunit [Lachnospiraceae bacterium]
MSKIVNGGAIGKSFPIDDAALKATGELSYVDDIKMPGMLHAKVLFSPVAHAKIKSIDTSAVKALPGVRAIVSYQNTPRVYYNSSGETIDVFKTECVFDDTVRFIGDKVAAVAADTAEIAARAIRLIRVEYEPLPVNIDPENGIKEDAYVIHTNGGLASGNLMETVSQSCGDTDRALRVSEFVFEDTFTVPAIHHGAIEPHASIAVFDATGKLTVITSSQDSFAVRINLSRIFSLPMSKVRVSVPAIGGAFGGKVDMITEPIAAALAMQCGKPVKLVYTRKEDMTSTRTRHAMKISLKMGFDAEGNILAEDMKVFCNAGAYASGTSNIVWAMCGKFFKVHKCKNLRFTGYPVITNTQPGGPMRGFGSPQVFFAQQRLMQKAANALGIEILEIQRKNLTLPDGIDYRFDLPHGNARVLDCLEKAAELIEYRTCLKEQKESKDKRFRIGVGIGVGAHGNGMYGIRTDITAMILKMNDDGSTVLFSGSHEMGNAAITLQKQMISQVLGIPMEKISAVAGDTETTPYQLGDYSSRGAFVSGKAAMMVALAMKEKLIGFAARYLNCELEKIVFKDGLFIAHELEKTNNTDAATIEDIVQYARHKEFTELICEVTQAPDAAVISYGAHIVKVSVDTETGHTVVLDYAAVHDVGKALNPLGVKGQIEGAIQMGLGYALSEEIQTDKNGKVLNPTLKKYHMLRANEMPKKIKIALIEKGEPSGPFGAKSIGECSVMPVAAAVSNAISNAVGCDFCDLPITSKKIQDAIKNI